MLTTVGRYFDPWEAHVLRARLEAEGVPASVSGDQHVIAYWPISMALGGVLLQVPSDYAEQAQDIIAAYHAGAFKQDLVAEHPEAADVCPACGASQITGTVPMEQRALTVATYLLALAPFPTRASSFQCNACGHRWEYGDQLDQAGAASRRR